MIDVYVEGLSIDIGRQGENLARNIYFDLSELINTYGEGTATLVHMRPSDKAPYVCAVTRSDTFLIWAPTSTDTAYAGSGKCELRWVVGDVLAKSIVYRTFVAESITGDSTVPSEYESWYEALLEHISKYEIASDQIETNAENIATNTNDIAVLDGRMDEFTKLPDGSTSGDAELVDIRVGANGTTYNSAGDAVRGQVSELKNSLTAESSYIRYGEITVSDIEQGTTSRGNPADSTTRLRTPLIPVKDGCIVSFTSGANVQNYVLQFYDENKTWTEEHETWRSTHETPIAFNGFIRVVFRSGSDNAEIAPSDYDATTKIIDPNLNITTVKNSVESLKNDMTAIVGYDFPIWERGSYDFSNNTLKPSSYNSNKRIRFPIDSPMEGKAGTVIKSVNTEFVFSCCTDIGGTKASSGFVSKYTLENDCDFWLLVKANNEGDYDSIDTRTLADSIRISIPSATSLDYRVNTIEDLVYFPLSTYRRLLSAISEPSYRITYMDVSLTEGDYVLSISGTMDSAKTTVIRVTKAHSINSSDIVKEVFNGMYEMGTPLNFSLSAIEAETATTITVYQNSAESADYTISIFNADQLKFEVDNLKKIVIDAVPSYYYENDYLPNKIDDVKEESAIVNGTVFAFITDLHFTANSKQSKYLLEKVMKQTPTQFVLCGGDLSVAYGTDATMNECADILTEYMDYIGKDNWFNIRGNHDFSIRAQSGATPIGFTQGRIYSELIRSSERFITNLDAVHMCYCIDIPTTKTRFIMLNTTDNNDIEGAGFSTAQLEWTINALTEMTGWKIIVVSHIASDSELTGYYDGLATLQSTLIAYKNKTGDFTNASNELICHINGHAHKDESHVENNLLSIATTCDAHYSDDGHGAVQGTITEQAFDVFCIDYDNKTINTVRIGRGLDRAWTYI